MNRPVLEVAGGSAGSMSKCSWPWCGVAPPHSAVISTSAPAAGIGPPSPATAAATGIVQSVRRLPETVGSQNVARSCSRLAMVAVGIPVAWYPPHGSGRALVSASGSYLGWLAAKRCSGCGTHQFARTASADPVTLRSCGSTMPANLGHPLCAPSMERG